MRRFPGFPERWCRMPDRIPPFFFGAFSCCQRYTNDMSLGLLLYNVTTSWPEFWQSDFSSSFTHQSSPSIPGGLNRPGDYMDHTRSRVPSSHKMKQEGCIKYERIRPQHQHASLFPLPQSIWLWVEDRRLESLTLNKWDVWKTKSFLQNHSCRMPHTTACGRWM